VRHQAHQTCSVSHISHMQCTMRRPFTVKSWYIASLCCLLPASYSWAVQAATRQSPDYTSNTGQHGSCIQPQQCIATATVSDTASALMLAAIKVKSARDQHSSSSSVQLFMHWHVPQLCLLLHCRPGCDTVAYPYHHDVAAYLRHYVEGLSS
jgi:hypothetical protein